MAKPIPSFLRLHVERLPELLPSLAADASSLDRFCREFTQATGWALRYECRAGGNSRATWSRSIAGGSPTTSGMLTLEPEADGIVNPRQVNGHALDLASATSLADAFGGLLNEYERTRHALWKREAELAAGVPVASRPDGQEHLAARLEAVLQAGAAAVGCQAAAIYLLDEGTSELKLRACWGLPKERLLEPARPLRGALGDLEALVGHAVVLEDVAALPHWKAPEEFPSAVCVPVSSPTTPLGTLWLFSAQQRDFTPQETNLIEIVAGRIASDLEREMLLQAGSDSQQLTRQMHAAAEWQRNRLPYAAPLIDGWQVAGWTSRADNLSSGFHDWLTLSDGAPAVLLGNVAGHGVSTGMSAAAMHAAVKAHAMHQPDAGELLVRAADSLVANSPGDERGTLFFARLDPDSGKLAYAAAGNLLGWLVNETDCRALSSIGPPLGTESEIPIRSTVEELARDDALVVIGQNPRDNRPMVVPTNLLCESLVDRRGQSAAGLLETVRAALASQANRVDSDTSVLVVKRRRSS